jgi:hypothetical protein
MADSQRSDVFVLESESQLFNRIISQEFNERDSDDEQSSLQSQQMMQGDQTMNTSASSEAQGAPIYKQFNSLYKLNSLWTLIHAGSSSPYTPSTNYILDILQR